MVNCKQLHVCELFAIILPNKTAMLASRFQHSLMVHLSNLFLDRSVKRQVLKIIKI